MLTLKYLVKLEQLSTDITANILQVRALKTYTLSR